MSLIRACSVFFDVIRFYVINRDDVPKLDVSTSAQKDLNLQVYNRKIK